MYSVDRDHASSPTDSTGYADIAMHFFPLGRFIFAASTTKAAEDAKATSREFFILNFHVNADFPAGRLDEFVTSSALRMMVVALFPEAAVQRFCCSAVYTSAGFVNSPEQTTI